MSADPRQIDAHARRLVALLGDETPFREDPESAVGLAFGIEVRYHHDSLSDCDFNGSYDHERGIITVDAAAVESRRRFTILHELCHALGHDDGEFQDWLFQFDAAGRNEEERVANAFASLILLPDHLVSEHIPENGPRARDVQQLAEMSFASREAACVRASQSLRAPGMVVLSRGGMVQLAINRGLPFAIRRETDMGSDSFFFEASQKPSLRRSDIRLRFPQSGVESSTLEADAVTDAQGYTFSVLMQGVAPWVALTSVPSGPIGHEIDCEQCDRTRITYKAECRVCGDHPCPDHGCSCNTWQRVKRARRCRDCNVELPSAAPAEVTLCDLCG